MRAELCRVDVPHSHGLDPCERRPALRPEDERLDVLPAATDHGFDAAVCKIPDPAADAQILRPAAHGNPETHALDPALDNKMPCLEGAHGKSAWDKKMIRAALMVSCRTHCFDRPIIVSGVRSCVSFCSL